MKRALVTVLGGLALLAALFIVSFYAGGYRRPERSLSQDLGDHLFMIHSTYMGGMEKRPALTEGEVERALARLDPRCHHEARDAAEWRLSTLAEIAPPLLVSRLEEIAPSLAAEPQGSEKRFRLRAVIRGLALLKVGAAVPRLVEILESDRDPKLRFELLKALGEIGDPRAIPTLNRIFQSPGTYIESNERKDSLEALAQIGGEATLILLAELNRSSDPKHIDAMCWFLGKTRDPRAAAALVELVRHPASNVRLSARTALDQTMGPAAVTPVLAALEREANDFVRANLIASVLDDADAHDDRVLAAFGRLIEDPAVGDYAGPALARYGGREALQVLLASAKAADPMWVMERLDFSSGWLHLVGPGVSGRPETVELLGRYLEHQSPSVRLKAIERLVVNGDPSALPAVEKLVLDPDPRVRHHARNAALTLDQWASLAAFVRLIPNPGVRREILSEFRSQYLVGFSKGFLVAARVAHRVALVLSVIFGLLLVFNAIRLFEPYRFTLLPLLLLFEGFVGDFWWAGDGYYLGTLHNDNVGPYQAAIAVHLLLLVGFIVLRPERGPATLPRRFGRLGGVSLWVILPGLLYLGAPAFAEAFRKAAASGAFMAAFFASFLLTGLLAAEEFLVPWPLFPRSARIERILTGMLSASLMFLLALALGNLARERWIAGDTDGAALCFLLMLPLAVLFFVYLARARPFAPTPAPGSPPPPPPGNRFKVRQDGETLAIQLPGWRLFPRDRIQIREGYVRRAYTLAGAALFGGSWSRRLPVGTSLPDLTSAEQAWLRSRLGHDPISSAESLATGLKLELKPQVHSRSEGRLRLELILTHSARRPWSLADLEQAEEEIAWKATVNGADADVSFSLREREAPIPPRRGTELHPRVYLPEPIFPGTPIEVSIICRAGESSAASAVLVLSA